MLNDDEVEEIETIPRETQEILNPEIDPLDDEVMEEIVIPEDSDYDRDYYWKVHDFLIFKQLILFFSSKWSELTKASMLF